MAIRTPALPRSGRRSKRRFPVSNHHELGDTPKEGYWLCYEFENGHPPDNVRYRRRQDAAFKLMLHAMYAIQILAPVGAPNLLLLYVRRTTA